MSKARICKTCKWLHNRVEPCCSCSRWGKGKTDHYIPAEETLGEYLERKEREAMEKEKVVDGLTTDELIKSLRICGDVKTTCAVCAFWKRANCADKLKNAAADRLEQLQQEWEDTSSTADERDDTARRCAEYIAEKHLQMDDTEWHIIPDDYWRHICGINARQEAKGRAKYGQSLEENTTLSTVQRIEHAQEELIDALKYLEHLKAVATDKLTANDYQRMAMRTAGEYDTDYDQLRNAAYGLNGEAGEVIDLLKKHEFQGHDLPDEKLIDECGDVLWYCALLADALGFSLEQVMNRNIDKLRKRYPDGFDKARSINREGEGCTK